MIPIVFLFGFALSKACFHDENTLVLCWNMQSGKSGAQLQLLRKRKGKYQPCVSGTWFPWRSDKYFRVTHTPGDCFQFSKIRLLCVQGSLKQLFVDEWVLWIKTSPKITMTLSLVPASDRRGRTSQQLHEVQTGWSIAMSCGGRTSGFFPMACSGSLFTDEWTRLGAWPVHTSPGKRDFYWFAKIDFNDW